MDNIKAYPRDRQTAINTIAHADYICEIDKGYLTFVRKNSDNTYTEPYYLKPMAFQHQFNISFDVDENIVSLCSNCYNEIPYGCDVYDIKREGYIAKKRCEAAK